MKAVLRSYRQSPRKVGLVADLIRGKNVMQARAILRSLNKRAAAPIEKLLASAVSNAKVNNSVGEENLFVKRIEVGKGKTMKRFRPVAFGRAHPIHKHMSHVSIVLEEKAPKEKKQKTKTAKKIA